MLPPFDMEFPQNDFIVYIYIYIWLKQQIVSTTKVNNKLFQPQRFTLPLKKFTQHYNIGIISRVLLCLSKRFVHIFTGNLGGNIDLKVIINPWPFLYLNFGLCKRLGLYPSMLSGALKVHGVKVLYSITVMSRAQASAELKLRRHESRLFTPLSCTQVFSKCILLKIY